MEWIKGNAYVNPFPYKMDRTITVNKSIHAVTHIYKYISDILHKSGETKVLSPSIN